jgi:tetratricopeptide (TPR) repeat protein
MEKALDLYGRHLHLEPASLDARFEMAVILDRAGRLDEALKHLLLVREARPGDVMVMNNIGVIYSKRKEFDQAVRIFENALRVDQNQPDLLVNAARAYFRIGDYPRAWACVIRVERLGAAPPAGLLSELNSAMLRPGSE